MFLLQTLIQKFTHLTRNYTLRVPKVDVFAVFQIPPPNSHHALAPAVGGSLWAQAFTVNDQNRPGDRGSLPRSNVRMWGSNPRSV